MQEYKEIQRELGSKRYKEALSYIPKGSPFHDVASTLDGTRVVHVPGCNQKSALTYALYSFNMRTDNWLKSPVTAHEMCWLGTDTTPLKLNIIEGASWADLINEFSALPAYLQSLYLPVLEMHGIHQLPEYLTCDTQYRLLQIGGYIYHALRELGITTFEWWVEFPRDFTITVPKHSQIGAASRYLRGAGYNLLRANRVKVRGLQRISKTPVSSARLENHLISYYGGEHLFMQKLQQEKELPIKTVSVATAEALRDLARETYPAARLCWKDGVGVALSIM